MVLLGGTNLRRLSSITALSRSHCTYPSKYEYLLKQAW